MEPAGWPLYRLARDSASEGRPSRLTGGSQTAGSGMIPAARPKAPLRPSLAAAAGLGEVGAEGLVAPWAGAVSIREPKGTDVSPSRRRQHPGDTLTTDGSSAKNGRTPRITPRTIAASMGKTIKFAEDYVRTGHGGLGGNGGSGGPQKEVFAASDLSKVQYTFFHPLFITSSRS